MSPTVLRHKEYRFFFFSREDRRPHIHVSCQDGEAKFWLDPTIELAENHGLKQFQITEAEKVIRQNL